MQIRKLALMTGLIALALMAVALFHVCLHSIDDNDAADSNHHCLLCAVFNHTILSFTFSSFLPTLPKANSSPLLTSQSSGDSPEQASIAVRAPPRLDLRS
jgi:hypothetical protein